jgi:hypothetical protein
LCALAGVSDEARAARLLEDAWRPFLVRHDVGDTWALLHDSMASFLTGGSEASTLGENDRVLAHELATASRRAHAEIADRILGSWGRLDGGLALLFTRLADGNPTPTDLYGLSHLVTHLVTAGSDDVHELLTATVALHVEGAGTLPARNLWFTLQERAGDLDGFASDVQRAWSTLGADDSTAPLEEHVRYAMMMSTTASIAESVPPGLLHELVKHRVWTLRQALAYVRRAPSAEARAFGLLELLDFMEAPESAQAVQDVEYLMEGVPSAEARFNLAVGLARVADESERKRCLREALSIAAEASEDFRVRAALMMRSTLTEPERRDAVEVALRRIEGGHSLDTTLLADVRLDLTAEDLLRVGRRISSLSNAYERAEGYTILAAAADGDGQTRLVAELRRALNELTAEERPPWHRAHVLTNLAIFAADAEQVDLLDEAEQLLGRAPARVELPSGDRLEREVAQIFEAMAGDERVYIARGYARLARARPDRAPLYGRRALELAAEVKEPGWALDVLFAVAKTDAYPPEIRHAAARGALSAAGRLDTRDEFLSFAGALAREVPHEDLPRVAAGVQRVGDASLRDHAAAQVLVFAAQLAGGRAHSTSLVRAACERVRRVRPPHARAKLTQLAAPLADRAGLATLLKGVEDLENEDWRAVALAELVPRLPRSLHNRATRVARGIDDDHYGVPLRALCAAYAARNSPARHRSGLVNAESARVGDAIAERMPRVRHDSAPFETWPEHGEIFVRAVEALGDIAPADSFDALIACVRRFPAAEYRVKALATLADRVPAASARDLLANTASTSADDFLALLDTNCVERLDEPALEVVVDVALNLDADEAGVALALLAERLTPSTAERAALQVLAHTRYSVAAAWGVGALLRSLRDHGDSEAAGRVARGLDKQLRRARTPAARFARVCASPWLGASAQRRTAAWLSRGTPAAWLAHGAPADASQRFRVVLPEEVRDALDRRLLPRSDATVGPDGAATLVANELARIRQPDLRRRLAAWAAPALLHAAPEPRFAALMAIIDSDVSDQVPFDARSEAWRAGVAIEMPPNRMWALDRLAAAEAPNEAAHAVQALRALSSARRPEFLMSLAPLAPLFARRSESAVVGVIEAVGELWP